MAWTAVHTFAVGDVLNASDLNTYLSANTDFLHSPPNVSVTHSTTQNFPDSAYANVNFNTERFKVQDSGMHSNSTNPHELIAVTAGKYWVWGHIEFTGGAVIVDLELLANLGGTTFIVDNDTNGDWPGNDTHVGKVISMAAGDFVFMQANQFNTGFTKADVRAASYSPEFGMVWVGS